jgi:hypothetical protein
VAVGSAAAVASVIAAESASAGAVASAQPALISSTVNVALLSNSLFAASSLAAPAAAGNPGAAGAIAQGVMRMLRVAKLKRAAIASCAILLLIGLIAPLFASAFRGAPPARPPRSVDRTPNALALSPASPPVYQVGFDGTATTVQLLGASPYPVESNSWFAANGQPVELPDTRLLGVQLATAVPPQYQVALRIVRPGSKMMRLHVDRADAGSNAIFADGNDAFLLVCVFSFSTPQQTAKLELGIADGRWETVAESDRPGESFQLDVADLGSVTFEPIEAADDGGTKVAVARTRMDNPQQLVVIDDAGREHTPGSVAVQILGMVTTTCTFDVPPDRVAKVGLQTQRFTRFVDVADASLESGRITHPIMTVRTR